MTDISKDAEMTAALPQSQQVNKNLSSTTATWRHRCSHCRDTWLWLHQSHGLWHRDSAGPVEINTADSRVDHGVWTRVVAGPRVHHRLVVHIQSQLLQHLFIVCSEVVQHVSSAHNKNQHNNTATSTAAAAAAATATTTTTTTMYVLTSSHRMLTVSPLHLAGWRCSSVVERRSLTGELSMVCTGPAADG